MNNDKRIVKAVREWLRRTAACTVREVCERTGTGTESFVHASQVVGEREGSVDFAEGGAETSSADKEKSKESKKTKAQLWNEMKISCTLNLSPSPSKNWSD